MKLGIGIIVDGWELPAWKYEVVRRILDSGTGSVSTVILDKRPETRSRRNALLSLYVWLDRIMLRARPDALERKNLQDLLGDVPVVTLKTNDSGSMTMDGPGPDILLHLGSKPIKGSPVRIPGFGIWSFEFGDERSPRYGLPGFWEIAENMLVVQSILRVQRGDNADETVLARSFSRTHKLSLNRTGNLSLWKCVPFISRKLGELSRLGPDAFFDNTIKEGGSNVGRKADDKNPDLFFVVAFVFRQAWRLLAHAFRKVRKHDQWALMYSVGNGFSTSFEQFEMLKPPKDRFWADPHVILKDGVYYVFIEEYPFSTGKGYISVIRIGPGEKPSSPELVLERDYHLSFPFVFQRNGSYYMIPETSSNRTIEVYESVDFPLKWKFKHELMKDLRAVDASVFSHLGKWWMFTSIADNDGAETIDELFVYYSDDPLSRDWVSHPLNPVVSDVRRARPAGRVFERNGVLFRPNQDCSEAYGMGVRINEIRVLTENEYEEIPAKLHTPHWREDLVGLHTFCHEKDITIIDVCIRESKR